MAATNNSVPETVMPIFDLPTSNPAVDGRDGPNRALGDYAESTAVVVVFACNHCPYVKHVWKELCRFSKDYADRGVQLFAINSNDAVRYPDDSFERMQEEAITRDFPFPYLWDEDQSVARAYDAACTPDIFVLDKERRLVYRGRLDSTRPGSGEANGDELRAAVNELLATGVVAGPQNPAIGCSIKWK